MAQVLLHLSDDLVRRFKQSVPPRQRSRFVERLLERALPSEEDDPIYRAALEVERDEALNAEMAEWDVTVGDGLEGWPEWDSCDPAERQRSPADLAAQIGVDPKRVRHVLRKLKIAKTGGRYELSQGDCERVAAEIGKGA